MTVTDTNRPLDYAERARAMQERDSRMCSCAHPNASHGSFNADGAFVGIGNAECGAGNLLGQTPCECKAFDALD